ncbi:hypothetical protein [Clavibacter nebraskensis]|uniref:Integral membrane protein n=1 Tax=Clavibacter nebraskensis TaxID=31963 RepID=A0ABY4MQG9_9MICO|nr:hypothetical protein [Clavibacter nebraskensis]QKO03341.1 hypothetical protein EGX35_14645 [Clavibacter nebraskensis]QLL36511.1 hypothetical protein EGX36_14690 [Clavibacter nebraskensis]QLL36614.1 hypothetical protein EGX37_14645 [Clavibacter nebraskensis]UQB05069.1 hypothetical protein LIV34_000048 [Clavibacter nebraskensis]UQB07890.1 hypothetical protein LIX21_000048 [Clavibacter nebraskensis]
MTTRKSLAATLAMAAILLGGVALVPHDFRIVAFVIACVLFAVGMRVFRMFTPTRSER